MSILMGNTRATAVTPVRTAGVVDSVYARLKGVVLLGGAVRPTALSAGIDRSLLDLPVDGGTTLLDTWIAQSEALATRRGLSQLSLMVMLDATSKAPRINSAGGERGSGSRRVEVQVKRDPSELRGTGGVLHDIAKELDAEDRLLVATGAHLLIEPLSDLFESLAARGADVGIIGHRDRTPAGLMLVRCGVLKDIASLGFVDLKEQALPAIARKHRVTVDQRETVSYPIRTTADYLAALRYFHRKNRGEKAVQEPFAEDWHSEFAVVEEGAKVDPSAKLFDSVVLSGAQVGPGSVLVRSIACEGATVKGGERLVEQLATDRSRRGGAQG